MSEMWDLLVVYALVGFVLAVPFVCMFLGLLTVRKPIVSIGRCDTDLRRMTRNRLLRHYFAGTALGVWIGDMALGGSWRALLVTAVVACPAAMLWTWVRMRRFSLLETSEDLWTDDLRGTWFFDRKVGRGVRVPGMRFSHGRAEALPWWVDLLFVLFFGIAGQVLMVLVRSWWR